jgi:hypothetical protein
MSCRPLPRPPAAVCLALGLLWTGPGRLPADTTNPPPDPRAVHKQVVAGWHARDLALARTGTNLWVRPGLVADRAARTVRVYGESTSLNLGDPVEFLLIAEQSGKDYEALAVSFAQPGDVHRALEFIGLKPGATANPGDLRFWPRGERVTITFALAATNGATTPIGRAESLTTDTRANAPLPETGFVFCGARWTNSLDDTLPATGLVYTADVFSPNSIVSIYNEPNTVLDVPRRAPQHEVYTFQVPNPERRLPATRLLQITLAPEFPDGAQRLIDWTLRVRGLTNGMPAFSVTSSDGSTALASAPESALAAAIQAATRPGRDVFATLLIDDPLPLGTLTSACATVERLEDTLGLRVEPPPAGHPYYKTFLPNPAHRDPARRPMQPFELTLCATGAGATGVLSLVTEEWKEGASDPVYHPASWPVASPKDLLPPLAGKDVPSVVLMFAPESMTYAQLRPYAAVAVEQRVILYVFTGLPQPVAGSQPQARSTP